MAPPQEQLIEGLRDFFTHDSFRPGQQEIIESILSEVPTIAIMPTGSGKSLCYQLPAVLLEGVTLVVSPLIALMKDQVFKLKQFGVPAESLSSADSAEQRRAVMNELKEGRLKLLYVAPERFRVGSFMEAIRELPISLMVIDEAHCISQWGHDFRPDYAKLGEVVQRLKPPRLAALTATATPDVQRDIIRSLGVDQVHSIVTGFDRENLLLSVEETSKGKAKLGATTRALKRWMKDGGSGIVYVATRKQSEELAEKLTNEGFQAQPYHAGLPSDVRAKVQETFQTQPDRVVVATSAFGMGVDKNDVRVVVHFQIPSSPEAYYQEVGRAGRDGLPAGGVLIYDQSDLRWAYIRYESSCPSYAAVRASFMHTKRRLTDPSLDHGFESTIEALQRHVGVSARASLVALEEAGDLRFDREGLRLNVESPTVDEAWLEHRARLERARLDAMIGYVMRAACRRRYLVDYFGDARRPDRCGLCDRCGQPPPRALTGDALRDALITLSCIARMRGRFGKQRVVDVLQGSRAKAVVEARLTQLSTYGLLAGWSKNDILALIDSLIRADLARITPTEYPKLVLTQIGVDALKADEHRVTIDLHLPRWAPRAHPMAALDKAPPRARKTEAIADEDFDGTLFEALRSWRREQARAQSVPTYVIAHDRLLKAVASAEPSNLDELGALPGMGAKRMEQYGKALLAVVQKSAETAISTPVV